MTARLHDCTIIMEYFLEHIARSLQREFGNGLKDHCLVFPNRRAGLFFMKYLAAELDKPVWTPANMTINDLFRSFSKLRMAENEILLFELYNAYKKLTGSGETFDDFYFWGDMLLNDFDDADKYLADISKLFRNVNDLKKIDEEFGEFTPEQAAIIKRFWVNFNPEKQTDEKRKFISIWSILHKLYQEFRKVLCENSLAYEGMIFREVTENKSWRTTSGNGWNTVHFIGFNALNECEKAIMLDLKKSGMARFYWDYDSSYIIPGNHNSAGFFMKDNLRVFGDDMPSEWSRDTLISSDSVSVTRKVINTSSDVAQVKLVPDLINNIPGLSPANAHETAIVLADENLLLPLLSSLPDNIREVNITMGYPLRHSSAYLLVKQLLEMFNNARLENNILLFRHADVMKVMKNPLIAGMLGPKDDEISKEILERKLVRVPADIFKKSEILQHIFIKPETPETISLYLQSLLASIMTDDETVAKEENSTKEVLPKTIRNEFIYRVLLSVNRLNTATRNSAIKLTAKTWSKILDRLLRVQSVPFSGEPLSGIQVMGILETRTLDFKNLIMLSVNDGILPSVTASSSFIPFSLREAFGLPSINHQESIYAYHFYRLLHRAENVTFIYNSNPEGLRSGEMSRFLLQMRYDELLEPEFLNLRFEIRNPGSLKNNIERTEEHLARIVSRFSPGKRKPGLSPSAINLWLNCRMKFYYRYVNDLKEPVITPEEIDPAMLGNLLHSAIRDLYINFRGKTIGKDTLEAISTNRKEISNLINAAIRKEFRREDDSFIAANEQIVRNVLNTYFSRIIEIDKKNAPFTLIDVEKPVHFRISGIDQEIIIGGVIDRIDVRKDITRIVDYKTGATSQSISSLNDLFREDRKKEADAWLQTLLYCEAYLEDKPDATVVPSVYKIKNIQDDLESDRLEIKAPKQPGVIVDDYSVIRQEFLEGLRSVVYKIYSTDEPFVMTDDIWSKCSWCPYRILCRR
jgi:hypothetical protein